MAERLALPTSDHGVGGSNPAGGEILPEPKRRFIAQSLSCSPFHHLEMTKILLKGRKTLTHPSMCSVFSSCSSCYSVSALIDDFVNLPSYYYINEDRTYDLMNHNFFCVTVGCIKLG